MRAVRAISAWRTIQQPRYYVSQDLHATLADLAGLPPTAPTALPPAIAAKQSQSFASIFTQPEKPFKNASYSQWPVCTKVANQSCMACTGPQSSRAVLDSMGYSIRVADWRLTVWLPFNNTVFVAEWDAAPIAVELYDHRTAQVVLDFDDDGEHENVASDQANSDIIATLTAQLRAEYSYDRNWLVQRMAKMAAGQANQATRDGYVDRPAPTSPDAFAAHA